MTSHTYAIGHYVALRSENFEKINIIATSLDLICFEKADIEFSLKDTLNDVRLVFREDNLLWVLRIGHSLS